MKWFEDESFASRDTVTSLTSACEALSAAREKPAKGQRLFWCVRCELYLPVEVMPAHAIHKVENDPST